MLRLHEDIAPFKAAVRQARARSRPPTRRAQVLPLLPRGAMMDAARALRDGLRARRVVVDLDASGASIGKRYRRQDEAGTPACITVDERTCADGTVTLRDRDSTAQVRVRIEEVLAAGGSRAPFAAALAASAAPRAHEG